MENLSDIEKFNTVLNCIDKIPSFSGEKDKLPNFLKRIEQLIPFIETLPQSHKQIILGSVEDKIIGNAKRNLMARGQFNSWTNIKSTLLEYHGEHTPINEIIDKISFCRCTSTVLDFYNRMNYLLSRLNNAFLLQDLLDDDRIKINNNLVLNSFKLNLPEPVKGLIITRNPTSLSQCYNIISNSGYLNHTNYYANYRRNNISLNSYISRNPNYDKTSQNVQFINKNINNDYYKHNDDIHRNCNNFNRNNFNSNYNNMRNKGNTKQINNHNQQNRQIFDNTNRRLYNTNNNSIRNDDVSMYSRDRRENPENMDISKNEIFANNLDYTGKVLPYILVKVGEHDHKFIIDTGAEFSIVNPKIFDQKWKIVQETMKLNVLNRNISSNTIYRLPIFSEFGVLNHFMEFLQYPFHTYYSGLIGNNILNKLNVIINFNTRILTTGVTEIPFYLNKFEEHFHNNELYADVFMSEANINNKFKICDNLNEEDSMKIKSLLNSYKDLFYKDGDILTCTKKIKHRIITQNEIPVYTKSYRYPVVHRQEVDEQIEEMLKQNIISPSTSPYNSPLWIVPKKLDNSNRQQWRLVIDYRKLNEITISDKFPIPNIEEIFDKLGKCQYFSTIDLAKGFHQIELYEADRAKTAFSTSNGHYEFNRMPFGLKNAPSTFQRLINFVLKDFINKTCVVYLDDILIFSTSIDEHILSLRQIFKQIQDNNLKIQINKCSFCDNYTKFLGHVVEAGAIRPDPQKTEIIKKIEIPKTQTQIKSFLGITGYYRKFIPDYAKVAYPLIKCLKKTEKINIQNNDYVNAFRNLKTLICSDPVLRNPNFSKSFVLTTDASMHSIGAVLSQENHPVCFASRTLNDHESRYSTIEKELLAIVWSVKYFRIYLYGRKFVIQTDHKPLLWLQNLKEPNLKLQRWKIILNEYDFEIQYVKGQHNKVADALSRLKIEKSDTDIDQHSICANELYTSLTIDNNNKNDSINIFTNDSRNEEHSDIESIVATIDSRDCENKIIEVSKAINIYKRQIYLKYSETSRIEQVEVNKKKKTFVHLENNDFLLELLNNLNLEKGTYCVYCENDQLFEIFENAHKRYYSKNNFLKILRSRKLLEDISDKEKMFAIIENEHIRNNHRGINEVFDELKGFYYYPNMVKLIHTFINNCTICNLAKYDRSPLQHSFNVTETPEHFNHIIQMDIWYPKRNIMYLTMIDRFSKHATIYKLNDRTWISILKALKQRIANFGHMKKLISDGENGILHKTVADFLKNNNIEFHQTTPGNKTGNSDIERFHSTLNEHLRLMECSNTDIDLDDKMLQILMIYNRTLHTTTKLRPIDFLIKNFDKETIHNLKLKFEAEKEARIAKLNTNRSKDISNLHNSIVKNRNIAKNCPKFKKLTNFRKDGEYVVDISSKRHNKYCKQQRKRIFKYQDPS